VTRRSIGHRRGASTARKISAVAGLAIVLVASACSSTNNGTGSTSSSSASTSATSTSAVGAPGSSVASPGSSAPAGTTPAALPARSKGCLIDVPPPVAGEHVDTELTSAGVKRSYKRYFPKTTQGSAMPLVVDLHGYSEGNAVHTAMSNLGALADKEGFLLVTPLGTGAIPFWNAVPAAGLPDDVQFISEVIDDASAHFCVDPSRVYVAGLSNGAFMSSLVACKLADKVAAIAPVAGLRWPDGCQPSRPVPIVAFHGTADTFVSYDGTPGAAAANLPLNDETKKAFEHLTFLPIPETLAKWATDEGCADKPAEEKVSASVKLIRYDGCNGGSTVELYVVDGGGHAWPGSDFSKSIERVVGPTTFEIDANALMWAFFKDHPLPAT
jgi:polyhydroxybutyrate depolymerase